VAEHGLGRQETDDTGEIGASITGYRNVYEFVLADADSR
jgi:hypothetical protein